MSIAAVALAHGLNANMLHKWVIDGKHRVVAPTPVAEPVPEPAAMPAPTFVPLALPAAMVDAEIHI